MDVERKDSNMDLNEPTLGTMTESAIDVDQIEALGQNVVESMRSLRELLDARTQALDACRTTLEDHYSQLAHEQENCARQESDLCERFEQREIELVERENRCQAIEQRLEEDQNLYEIRSQELCAKEKDIEEHAAQIEQHRQGIIQQETEIEAKELQLAQEQERIREQADTLNNERVNLENASRDFIETQSQFEDQRAEWEARQTALSRAETELHERAQQLQREREALAAERATLQCEHDELKTQKAELAQLTDTLKQQEQDLNQQRVELTEIRQEWHARMREVDVVRDGLAKLQEQMAIELQSTVDHRDHLLERFGPTTGNQTPPSAAATDLPTAADLNARESIERFQKLCRDAKRRAIGA